MIPSVNKSSRHSKITGDFAEYLVLYWLSKHGTECAKVDHVGMDIIARRPGSLVPMGISVKSRSRNPGTEGSYLSIPNENFEKLDRACISFSCEPYFAIVIDEASEIDVYLLPSAVLQELCPPRQRVASWKMSPTWRQRYAGDERIVKFSLSTQISQWWDSTDPLPVGG